MAEGPRDDVLRLVEHIYQAATHPEQWDKVLRETTRLIGGSGALLEVFKKPPPGHRLFYSYGIPTDLFDEYAAYIAANSPRFDYAIRQPVGRIIYDYQFITEQEMSHDESYNFYARGDGKYFLGGILQKDAQNFGVVTVQRSAKQGHADRRDIELMQLLLPHFRSALQLGLRWSEVEAQSTAIHDALNCLSDGVFLLRNDATISFASETAQQMARAADGFSIRENSVQVESIASRLAFQQALEDLRLSSEWIPSERSVRDIPVHRRSGQPPLVFTLKPVRLQSDDAAFKDHPVYILFAHDPLRVVHHDWALVGKLFGLTAAELDLTQSLFTGVSLPDYARVHGLSMNTVYTHYRHLKDKMKCDGQLALIKKLTDLMPRTG